MSKNTISIFTSSTKTLEYELNLKKMENEKLQTELDSFKEEKRKEFKVS